jgi:Na+/proline symporter
MIPVGVVASISLLYFGLLFAVAFYADKRREAGRSIISNPHIYSLSLAVYATSWTYYGSVGRAATSGLDFLPVYLGPTLIAFSWWFLLRKMVRVSKEHNIVSIADFISSRYGKSAVLGAVVTVFAVVGIMPYIALQLKAVSRTFDLLTASPESVGDGVKRLIPALPPYADTALIVALVLGIFGVLFGARNLDASERHEGLVAAVALESLVKIVAFVAVGILVTFGIFDGFGDIFTRLATELPDHRHLLLIDTPQIPYTMWFTLTFISMMAVMFLPRQFHIMVIENSNEKHISDAMWRFPIYMFLINLFVLPIALGGLLLNGGDATQADYFVLHLPLQTGHSWLAVLVFIGGFSASAGMVMVESVALSTMILNHLVMPVILRLRIEAADISGLLINIKRLGIMAVIFLGYFYYKVIGESYALVNIGLVSFVAAAQFAPSLIGGLFWKRANLRGATTGLILGFLVWFYTLLIPSFVRSGWMESDILDRGLFGLRFLRPLELFGLSGFDIWSHSLFWTYFFNIGAFLTLSLLTRAAKSEVEQALKVVDVFAPPAEQDKRKRLSRAPTVIEFVDLMTKFIGEKQAHTAIAQYLGNREIDQRGSLSEYDLPNLKRFTERTLAGSVGAAPARIIIENYLSARGSRMEDVFDIFGSVTISRTSSREQLGVLYEAARVVASGADLPKTFDNILDLLLQQFKFDLCVIRILDENREVLTVHSQKGMSLEHLGLSERGLSPDTYIGEAFVNNSVVVVNDTDFMDKAVSAQIIHREGIKSFAHAPITIEGQPIGVLSAFSRTAKGIFTDEFVALFGSLAGQIGVACRNARQTEGLITAREQERELQIAKQIQLGLLPDKLPRIPGIALAGICVPAHQVGGDYYDYLQRGDNLLDLVIADVSGHNVGAALLMAETRTFIQARAQGIHRASEVMSALNEFFYEDLTRAELFITMFYAIYDAAGRRLSFASAGHNPPILWRTNAMSHERLDADGLILGVKRGVFFEEKQVQLHPGDVLLLYTDGITEAENPAGIFFGEERLISLFAEYHRLPPQQIIDKLLEQVRLFAGIQHFNDDVSLVVMRVETGEAEAEPAIESG